MATTKSRKKKSRTEVRVPPSLIRPTVALAGHDGSAGSIIGRVALALRRASNPESVINEFRTEAMSGDYEHVLDAACAYAEVE